MKKISAAGKAKEFPVLFAVMCIHMKKLLLVGALMLTGCASDQIIRKEIAGSCNYVMSSEGTSNLEKNTCEKYSAIYEINSYTANKSCRNNHMYDLHFVEIDDQGLFFDRNQMNSALKSLSECSGNVDIVMFIHGWHHNASASDQNVLDFQEVLRKLAARNPSRHIFGIFVGWKGKSLNVPLLKEFTFWERKNTSIEVGRGQFYELVEQLQFASKTIKNSRVINIGHSFGASVLLSATKNNLVREINLRKNGGVINNVTTVLVNPAIEAIHYFPVFEQSERIKEEDQAAYTTPSMPIVAIFSSESDRATQKYFPIGRFLSTRFESHSKKSLKNRNGKLVELSESDMDTTALGNYDKFITHELRSSDSNVEINDECKITPKKWSDVIGLEQSEGWTANFRESGALLKHLKNSPAFSPAWVVKVQDSIIRDHTKIWSARFNCFLEELILLQ